jgi:GT2 family glycosyltransferase
MRVSVVIPSLDRGAMLLDTVHALRALARPPEEIIVVDQSKAHPTPVWQRLDALAAAGALRLERRSQRSITAAMNAGVALARGELIVFLDDDVRLDGEIIAAHESCHRRHDVAIVAGRIIQPWHDAAQATLGYAPEPRQPDRTVLHTGPAREVRRFGAGNVSMRRAWILRVGGFDENFVGAAYRFEADFAARVLRGGGTIRFEPHACIHHLHAAHGGTRSFGEHLGTLAAWHSAGRWYYLMRHPRTPGLFGITLGESARAVLARRHLRAPWNSVVALVAELRGVASAAGAALRGPRLGLAPGGHR